MRRRVAWIVVDVIAWCALVALAVLPARGMHPLVAGYAFDVVAPFAVFSALRQIQPRWPPTLLAAALFALCLVAELSQLLDLSALGVPAGVFDPWDLLAYAVGIGLGVARRGPAPAVDPRGVA